MRGLLAVSAELATVLALFGTTAAVALADDPNTETGTRPSGGYVATMGLQGDQAVGQVTNNNATAGTVAASSYTIGPNGEHDWAGQQLDSRVTATVPARSTATVAVLTACGRQTQSDVEIPDSSGNFGLPGGTQNAIAWVLTTRPCPTPPPSNPPSTPSTGDHTDRRVAICHNDESSRFGQQMVKRLVEPDQVSAYLKSASGLDYLMPAGGNCGPTNP